MRDNVTPLDYMPLAQLCNDKTTGSYRISWYREGAATYLCAPQQNEISKLYSEAIAHAPPRG